MRIDTFKYWWLVGLKGLVILILGLLAMAHPVDITKAAVLTSAVFVGTGGLFILFFGFKNPLRYMRPWFLLEGFFDLMVAVLIALNTYLTAAVLSIIFGIWLLVNSFFRLHVAYRQYQIDGDWKTSSANGILTLILSLAFIMYPESGIISFGMLLGIILASYGTFLMGTSFRQCWQKT